MLDYLSKALLAFGRYDLLYLNIEDPAFKDRLLIDGLLEKHIVTAIDLAHVSTLFPR